MPLLRGEVRFTRPGSGGPKSASRPVADGGWRLPPDHAVQRLLRRDWAFEDLAIAQLLVTTRRLTTGPHRSVLCRRTCGSKAQTLAGPWRIEGRRRACRSGSSPASLRANRTVQVKLSGGGDRPSALRHRRQDRAFGRRGRRSARPDVAGNGQGSLRARRRRSRPRACRSRSPFSRLQDRRPRGRARRPLPGGGGGRREPSARRRGRHQARRAASLASSSKASASTSTASSSRPPAGKCFMGRRVGAASAFTFRSISIWRCPASGSVRRSCRIWRSKRPSCGAAPNSRGRIHRAGPRPGSRWRASSGSTEGGANGRVALASSASDRFARYLASLGCPAPFAALLDGRPLEAAADIMIADPVTSFRNCGSVSARPGSPATCATPRRRSRPAGGWRRRSPCRASISTELPPVASLFGAARNLDVGLILDARGLRYGSQTGAGRIVARSSRTAPHWSSRRSTFQILPGPTPASAAASPRRLRPHRRQGDGEARRAARRSGRPRLGRRRFAARAPFPARGRVGPRHRGRAHAGAAGSLATLPLDDCRGTAAGGLFEADVLSVDGRTETPGLAACNRQHRPVGRASPTPPSCAAPRTSTLRASGCRPDSSTSRVFGDVGGVAIRTRALRARVGRRCGRYAARPISYAPT